MIWPWHLEIINATLGQEKHTLSCLLPSQHWSCKLVFLTHPTSHPFGFRRRNALPILATASKSASNLRLADGDSFWFREAEDFAFALAFDLAFGVPFALGLAFDLALAFCLGLGGTTAAFNACWPFWSTFAFSGKTSKLGATSAGAPDPLRGLRSSPHLDVAVAILQAVCLAALVAKPALHPDVAERIDGYVLCKAKHLHLGSSQIVTMKSKTTMQNKTICNLYNIPTSNISNTYVIM